MKFRPAWTMGAVVILACASILAVRYIERIPSQRLATLLGITVTVSDRNYQESTPSPRLLPFENDQPLVGSAVVQTFLGSTLIRQGPGTVVSSDGLLLTSGAAAPYGSGSYVYQITTTEGHVLRARRVASDRVSGLVLLKSEATDLDAVLFDTGDPTITGGEQLQAVTSEIQVSLFTTLRLPLWVVGKSRDGNVLLSLDRNFGRAFHGARILDHSGRSVGVLGYGSNPVFIGAEKVNAFLDAYLAREFTK